MNTILDSLVDEQRISFSATVKYCTATENIKIACTASDDIDAQYKMTHKSRGGRTRMNNIPMLKCYLSQPLCQPSCFCPTEYVLRAMDSGCDQNTLHFIKPGEDDEDP